MARRRFNMIPWGLERDGEIGADPGETVTYNWRIPKEVVPAENQPACNGHVYVSNIDEVADVYTGLVGPLIICRKGGLDENGNMVEVDAEFFLSFLVYDETGSHYLDQNIREFAEGDLETFDKEDEDFLENNKMHAMNGRLGFLEGLEMYEGDRVIWHLHGLGNEVDIHTVHFHAHAYNYISDYKTHGDVFSLFPGKTGTVVMEVDAIGTWLVHCHVNDHMIGGMSTTYTVHPREEKSMHRTRCYISSRRGRRYHLRCLFESPRQMEDFTEKTSQNTIEVCANAHTCHSISNIPPKRVFRLSISTTFSVDSDTFRRLMTSFTLLTQIDASNIGLRSLHPRTFSTNRWLRRIILTNNHLQDISRDCLASLLRLYSVDLRHNDLYFGKSTNPRNKFLGVLRRIDLRDNARLGTNQKVFAFRAAS